MLLESFSMAIMRWLRIPPGVALRKVDGPSTSSSWNSGKQNEYINAMLDITVDDICIGDAPLSVNYDSNTPEDQVKKLKDIAEELNTIVKWAVKDIAAQGYSVYDVSIEKKTNKLILLPYLKEVKWYLTKNKTVVIQDPEKETTLTGKLIFINFDKDSLSEYTGKNKSIAFEITPAPMQLKNATLTESGIQSAENSIAKYRAQLGRLVRVANVDVGIAQGDTQKDVVDGISEAINADSASLNGGTPYTEYDDNIPVLPNRKGLGKVDISESIPNVNIKDLADLDYWIGKLALIMRFPTTYLDFSKNLDATAVSMIRGDLRYAKLCKSIGTKVETTINKWVQDSDFRQYHPVFSLTKLPSSEDDDVITALDSYVDIAEKVEGFVIGDDGDAKAQLHRLELLQDLVGTSTNSPALQAWFEDFKKFITKEGDSTTADDDINFDAPSKEVKSPTIEEDLSDLNLEETIQEPLPNEPEVPEGDFLAPQTE